MLRTGLTIAFIIAGVLAADAETTIVLNPKDRVMMPGAEQVRVSVGINMFVPLTDGGEQAIKAQEDARRLVYDLAARECAILRDVLASECRLESINVNVQRNQFGPQKDGLNVNGNVGFRIVPK
jgi:glutamine amidotransferase PdxT